MNHPPHRDLPHPTHPRTSTRRAFFFSFFPLFFESRERSILVGLILARLPQSLIDVFHSVLGELRDGDRDDRVSRQKKLQTGGGRGDVRQSLQARVPDVLESRLQLR